MELTAERFVTAFRQTILPIFYQKWLPWLNQYAAVDEWRAWNLFTVGLDYKQVAPNLLFYYPLGHHIKQCFPDLSGPDKSADANGFVLFFRKKFSYLISTEATDTQPGSTTFYAADPGNDYQLAVVPCEHSIFTHDVIRTAHLRCDLKVLISQEPELSNGHPEQDAASVLTSVISQAYAFGVEKAETEYVLILNPNNHEGQFTEWAIRTYDGTGRETSRTAILPPEIETIKTNSLSNS